jgi:hypothetical protein
VIRITRGDADVRHHTNQIPGIRYDFYGSVPRCAVSGEPRGGDMMRLMLMAVAVACVAGAGFLAASERAEAPAALQGGPEVEQRFLIKFCYAQYRHQSDVTRCLGRGGT